jgi:hypothetical protein
MAVGVFDEGERETQTARYETVRWLFFFTLVCLGLGLFFGLVVSLSWPQSKLKLAVLPCMLRPSRTYLDEAKPRQEMLPGSYERSPA